MDYSFIHQSTVGLDKFIDTLDHLLKKEHLTRSPTYPPYNIIQTDDFNYMIELAVAGFSENELNVDYADDNLTVSGRKKTPTDDTETYQYMYRGISGRSFDRKFVLSPDVQVNGVSLQDGILKIDLEKIVPNHKKPRSIPINKQIAHDKNKTKAPELLTEKLEGS